MEVDIKPSQLTPGLETFPHTLTALTHLDTFDNPRKCDISAISMHSTKCSKSPAAALFPER